MPDVPYEPPPVDPPDATPEPTPDVTPAEVPNAAVPIDSELPPTTTVTETVTTTEPIDDGPTDASRQAWLWAGGLVLLALITAVIVVLLATRTGSPVPVAQATATASPTSATASPLASTTATAAATAAPATAAPVPNTPAQQAAILFPPSGTACGGVGANYSACPVTAALITAANQWRTNHNPSSPEPLCRCPVPYQNPIATQDDSQLPGGLQGQPDKAAVAVTLGFAPSSQETVIVYFQRQADGTWLAFDTNCASAGGGSAGGTGNVLSNSGSQICTVS